MHSLLLDLLGEVEDASIGLYIHMYEVIICSPLPCLMLHALIE